MTAYYNENDPFAAQWLRNLIAEGKIADGEVDERSIADVQPDDLDGFDQVHLFAGIAGWPHALRLAGVPDDLPVWTGSCPCQPFSVAGKGRGTDDERHLWPEFFRLIAARRPSLVMGEQVAGAAGYAWFDGIAADLEGANYACGAADIPACAVDAPHIRQRLYWIACDMADANVDRQGDEHVQRSRQLGGIGRNQETRARRDGSFWSDHVWLAGADGKARRSKPGLPLLVDGVPGRLAQLRAIGNAIVPALAAEVISAWREAA